MQDLDKLLQQKVYWERKKTRRLRKIYFHAILPLTILIIGSLIWVIMGWGIIAGWLWIITGISSAGWSVYWIWKYHTCSKKLTLINKKIKSLRS